MKTCPSCREENPERFRLCGFCGAALVAPLPPREVRKRVSIVFSDLKESTSLGESLDSESLREVMSRYFDEMSAVLQEHGGLIEKYIGDAIMAVFGLPIAHEDDALRAVRAAHAMTRALASLNGELEQRWGVRLTNRTGVNTGEVVAGDPATGQRLITGDAVNVAARLEQAAPANEVLIGEPTYRIVRDAVEVEALDPLDLKGKAEPLPAYRLLSVVDLGPLPRRHDVPLVGRERELALLHTTLEAVDASSACRVVTVVADAGVGKSRLIAEFAALAHGRGAGVVLGRCLPYGRGITFWPIVEMVRELAGIGEGDPPALARSRIVALAENAEVADRIGALLGLNELEFPLDELYWGARKLFEAATRDGPLVAVLEDIHWAEPALLDLVDHLLAHGQEIPLLVVCSTRPDLKERKPDWSERPGTDELELGALSADETGRVIEHRLGSTEVAPEIRDRIVRSSEGNPLYVEQLVAMLIDEGALRRDDGRWVATDALAEADAIPPTIEALLAARLDRLSEQELVVLEAASVIGTMFPRTALDELVPEAVRPDVDTHLLALSEKHLIRPESTDTRGALGTSGGGTMRFHHVLIRDAAYNRLLKRARAELHERFADWAERVNQDREREAEYEEIVGYHLEQAARYLGELAPLDDHGRTLAARAAAHLGPAGRRAFRRGDMGAAANLLRRAVALLPEGSRERLTLRPELAEAMMEIGEFAWAELHVSDAVTEATELGDEVLRADAILTQLLVRHHTIDDLDSWRTEVEREADRVITSLDPETAPAVLAKAWRMVGYVHGTACAWGATAIAEQRAIEHARRAGDARQEARLSAAYVSALTDGPTPTSEALIRAQEIIDRGLPDRQAEALVLLSLGVLHAMRADFAPARDFTKAAVELLRDRSAALLAAHTSLRSARVELLAGDPEAAHAELRRDYERLTALDERYFRPVIGAGLARVLVDLGRDEEADETAATAASLAAEDDIEAQALVRSVRAQLLSARGDHLGAEQQARGALAFVRRADAPAAQADALVDLGQILVRGGHTDEGARAFEEARHLYARKEHLVGVSRVLEDLTRYAAAV